MYKTKIALSAAALGIAQAFPAAALAQTDAPVTEVVITGARADAAHASVAGFADTPLLQTPASVGVITREQMQALNIRSTTDAARYDASIGDAYNAVGYAEQFSIRGFKLDNARSYRKDGLAISGDTQIPLENKESIEVLKGLAGLQAGVAAPGGIVNYVTKRPTAETLRSALVEVSERGTVLGTLDLGGRLADRRFGYRINVATERLRSYIEGADGHRNFISGAFDWRITPQALLQIDADYQNKAQVSAPGFQLIDNRTLPGVAADTMLNNQPWSFPVKTETSNVGVRFQYEFTPEWRAVLSANRHDFKRDDYTAFPLGCGPDLGVGFCASGDYDVYDYRSLGEKKKPLAAQAMLQGRFATGALRHELTAGLSYFQNKESWGDYLYAYAGTSNIHRPVIVAPAEGSSGPVSERRVDRESSLFAQDIVGLTEQLKLHAGARYTKVRRSEVGLDAQTDAGFWLPNVALVFSPRDNVSGYVSYAQGLEHGGIAPIGTTFPNRALEPGKSKQVELGVKAQVRGINLAAALFQIEKGLEYTDASNTYVRNGEARHRGLEMSASGKPTRDLAVGASLAALHTEQQGTGQGYDGKRVTNVPAFRSTVFAEYALPRVAGLKVNGDWQFVGKKAFDEENTVMVPKYHVLNLGASYATKVAGMPLVLRAQVRNALDKFYWRDVTPDLGGYLFPGAERTYRLSAQLDF
ncbi:TonB-dependent siderophore receptor [Pseudoduganella chitinolytica]|uniref:TonB-dependent siderophore receptor n=1 Tax=Pseudoduganella chitinolytica TaxID=34070 RepID=A0ABY8BFF3_9BURK|nr:TonB-dependent siderophore receptor [Pseudoduganella chitinolytica]WEF33696.1 TonB-dependent siderophore receptor [Pseudoduganella chitinolytica]